MKNKKNIILIIMVIVISSMVYFFYVNKQSSKHSSLVSNNGNTANNSKNNMKTLNQTESSNKSSVKKVPDNSTNNEIKVTITGFSQAGSSVNVRAFISGIINTGECTFSFSNESIGFSKKTTASQNASTTGCLPLVLNSSDFPVLGKWSVVVSYEYMGIEYKSSAVYLNIV